jgi:peptide/nickel transport system substrate-binding protein
MMEIVAGASDIIEVGLTYAEDLNNTGKVKLYTGFSDRQMMLNFLVCCMDSDYRDSLGGRFYTQDKRIRQAILYALDRQEIIDIVLNGFGKIPAGIVRYGFPGYFPDLVTYYEHDIDKAKDLLAEAGYPNGFPITLTVEGRDYRPYAEDAAIVIKDQLAKVGIDVTLDVMDKATFNDARFNQKFELSLNGRRRGNIGWAEAIACIEYYHSMWMGPGAGNYNLMMVNNSEVDEIIEQMLDTELSDEETLTDLARELQTLALEEAYEVNLWDRLAVHASTQKVMDYELDPSIGVTVWRPEAGFKLWVEE